MKILGQKVICVQLSLHLSLILERNWSFIVRNVFSVSNLVFLTITTRLWAVFFKIIDSIKVSDFAIVSPH